MKIFLALIITMILIGDMASFGQGGGVNFEGRVYEETSMRGLSGFTMKMIPPKTSRRPEMITTTNSEGEFRFINIERGNYLLEVYQGITILYRSEVVINQDTSREIPIRRRR